MPQTICFERKTRRKRLSVTTQFS